MRRMWSSRIGSRRRCEGFFGRTSRDRDRTDLSCRNRQQSCLVAKGSMSVPRIHDIGRQKLIQELSLFGRSLIGNHTTDIARARLSAACARRLDPSGRRRVRIVQRIQSAALSAGLPSALTGCFAAMPTTSKSVCGRLHHFQGLRMTLVHPFSRLSKLL